MRRQFLDLYPAGEQRGERPADPGLVDGEPGTVVIQELHLGDVQIGREQAAQLGDLETVARDKGRQRPLARSCLQADEEQRHQAQQPAADPGEEATRAHQKACPMLT